MNLLEMMAYKASHQSGLDCWRCMICSISEKLTEKQAIIHLVDFHNIRKELLIIDGSDGSIFKECEDLDEECEVTLDLESDESKSSKTKTNTFQ